MNFGKYLPIESYTLVTKLPVEEVLKRLADNIEPEKIIRFSLFNKATGKPYEGQMVGRTFKITRIIDYRNSFLPVITGRISSFLGETEIKVKMRLSPFIFVFMSFWLGTVVFFGLQIIYTQLFELRQFSSVILAPLGMFLFGYLLTILPFKAESKKSKAFLATLFDGHREIGRYT